MKKLRTAVTAILLCALLSAPAYAVYDSVTPVSTESASVARAEETQWYFRNYNGILQKRLWSITYMKWLTEWENA